ncbi:hypothetical protein C9J41_15930 [Photobacterium sp. GB-50]|nr:hypothetical protein C9J40_09050 [Photobacterium sp. GB-72]PSV41541.1 hypothetical protein C9J46_17780 [Photobacterium sp. GB-36]PSV53639.1 hypothetical protein C9J45_06190 [Photobacterium sp. GB-1]PSV57247.1 hypothetical protein C9J43_08720 [Photobacterium sp. GB-3]PSW72589.1 hypothetical protein C9J41_15930 [Photobacterium sp. GB-50]
MTIKLDFNTVKTLRISIYQDFNVMTSGSVLPISSSLLTSGTIVNGDFNGTIRVTHSMEFILIQLYDSNANQLFYQAVKETSPSGITIVE